MKYGKGEFLQIGDGYKVFDNNRVFIGTVDTVDEAMDLLDKGREAVNHPSHYAKGGVECIDAIKASMSSEAFNGFLKGNVLKYVWRYESKAKPVEDLKKAKWYLEKLMSEVEND
jgi:hypothetical protein